MTNLRWIESEIDRLIFSIERLKILNKNGDVVIQEKRLTHLKQIKAKLEAWEVVKPNIKYEEAENNEGVYMEYILYLEIEEWKPEAFKIKKALEVK